MAIKNTGFRLEKGCFAVFIKDFFYVAQIEIIVEPGGRISILYFGLRAAGESEDERQNVRAVECVSVQDLYSIVNVLERTLAFARESSRWFYCVDMIRSVGNTKQADTMLMSIEKCQSFVLLGRLALNMLEDDDVVSFTIGI